MKAEIKEVIGCGILDEECVVIVVTNDFIGYGTVIGDADYSHGDHDLAIVVIAYPLPLVKYEVGDVICLHSKHGKNYRQEMKNGNATYHYFWGCKSARWSECYHVPKILYDPRNKLINR